MPNEIHETRFVAETATGAMTCFGACPAGERRYPLVVVCHDGPGIRPAVHDVLRRIAAGGFAAVLPDLYHRQGHLVAFDPDKLRAGDTEERARMLTTVAATTAEDMVTDVRLAVAAARAALPVRPGAAGIVGFCHTARTVLAALADHASEFAAGAALHPSFVVTDDPRSVHRRAGGIRGPLYLGFGGADHSAPFEQQRPLMDELERHGVPAEIEVHQGAGHGFAFAGPRHDRQAADRAFGRVIAMLSHVLKTSDGRRR